MKFKIFCFLFCFLISFFSYFFFIPFLKKKKVSQSFRKEGPRSHFKKEGTPTFGGVIIVFGFLLFLSFFMKFFYLKYFLVLFVSLSFFLIGFFDDFMIIKKKNNKGIKPSTRLFLEILISGVIYFFYLTIFHDNTINFFGTFLNIHFFYGIFILLSLTFFANATNFTDGLDGLLALVSFSSFLGLLVLSILTNDEFVLIISLGMISSDLAFLVFNLNKAKIFMGDSGSLFHGAIFVICLILLKKEVLLIFFGFVYILEIMSVIIQVWFFKRSKGERIFKMAPLHHHFEALGLLEKNVVWLFFLVNLLTSIIGVILGVMI